MPPIFSDKVSNIAKRFRARGRIALSGVGLRPLVGPVGGGSSSRTFESARKLGAAISQVKAVELALARRYMPKTMPISRRRLFLGLAAIPAALGVGAATQARLARYYDGPPSDHFDGLRFFDAESSPAKKLADTLQFFSRRGEPWPERAPSPYADRPPARVDGKTIRVSYVGHASVLIQTAGVNILCDPVWSERASPFAFVGPKRVNDPGIAFDALPPIDLVLVSHCHYDHLDVVTLSRLAAAHRPRVITPLGNDAIMHAYDPEIRAAAYDWNARIDLGRGFAVNLFPIRHWSARGLLDRNKALWASFVIETPNGKIWFVADSGYGDGHYFRAARARGPFRLAILPIGAYEPRWFMRDQHMNPEEAVQALADCGAEFALAHHHGTFKLTYEAIDAPRVALAAALKAARISSERFRAPFPGEVWDIA
jgi:L-ascorbate metabolism protein UlaG (beta-lactamase superfamily)